MSCEFINRCPSAVGGCEKYDTVSRKCMDRICNSYQSVGYMVKSLQNEIIKRDEIIANLEKCIVSQSLELSKRSCKI